MKYQIVEARHLRGHTLWLKCRDGTAGEIDLTNELNGPVLAALRDIALFKQFSILPEFARSYGPTAPTLRLSFYTTMSK